MRRIVGNRIAASLCEELPVAYRANRYLQVESEAQSGPIRLFDEYMRVVADRA